MAIRYDAAVHSESAAAVWARIEALSRTDPGGVVATDGDGTLWQGDVGEDLFHAFIEAGRVEPPALEALRRNARDHAVSDAGGGSDIARRIYSAYIEGRFPEERVCELMTWCFAGWTRADLQAFARDVVAGARLESRLHREVHEVLAQVRQSGIKLFLVSASPVAVVVEAAAVAGVDVEGVIAARPCFHGDVVLADVERPIPYAGGKVTRLRERMGQGQPLYAAFGDNAFDVAMLASARVPVAVRPKARLRACADSVAGIVELAPLPSAVDGGGSSVAAPGR
jgi:phosphoserine phosphatase